MLQMIFRILLVVLAPTITSAGQQSNDPCGKAALPNLVSEVLARNFPSWRPLRMEDLLKDDQELWSQAKPNLCPGFATGHFESMEYLSYAVILVGSDQAKGYKLVALTAGTGNRYKANVLFEEKRKDSEQYALYPVVHSLPPGEYQDFYDSSRKVKIRLDAIALERLEAWMTMFYLEKGQFNKLRLSD